MHKHVFGMTIKTEQINMDNTATQLFNQDNKTAAHFPIFIYLSIILLYLLVI